MRLTQKAAVLSFSALLALSDATNALAQNFGVNFGGSGSDPFESAEGIMQKIVDFILGPVAIVASVLAVAFLAYSYMTGRLSTTRIIGTLAAMVALGTIGGIIALTGVGESSISIGN